MTEPIVAEAPASCQDMHGLLLEIREEQQAQRRELRSIKHYLGLPGWEESVAQRAHHRHERTACDQRNIAVFERLAGNSSGRKEDA